MIIGYLIPGVLVALLSAAVALLSGYGILAAFGFYVLGGSLTLVGAVCISALIHMVQTPQLLALKT